MGGSIQPSAMQTMRSGAGSAERGHQVRIKVLISVETLDAQPGSSMPRVLGWEHVETAGDNPRYYGDSIQRAISNAAKYAVEGAQVYVDLEEKE